MKNKQENRKIHINVVKYQRHTSTEVMRSVWKEEKHLNEVCEHVLEAESATKRIKQRCSAFVEKRLCNSDVRPSRQQA